MELDPVDAALARLERGNGGRRRGGQRSEARRRLEDRVAVRHPAGLLRRGPGEQPAAAADEQLRATELADLGSLDAAAELAGEQLHAVADAEHGNAELEQPRVEPRRAVGVDRRRATGQDQAARPEAADLSGPT